MWSLGSSYSEKKCSTWSMDRQNSVMDAKCWMSLTAFQGFTGQSLAKWHFFLQMKYLLFLWLEAYLEWDYFLLKNQNCLQRRFPDEDENLDFLK